MSAIWHPELREEGFFEAKFYCLHASLTATNMFVLVTVMLRPPTSCIYKH